MATKEVAPRALADSISVFLQHGSILKNFKFPRLYMPNIAIAGYKPEYYADIGRKIACGDIKVFLGEGMIQGGLAMYNFDENSLTLTKATGPLKTPKQWSTIVHEATHMIQDMKKWRMTKIEMEADAHFSEALFLCYKGIRLSNGYMPSFDIAARAFSSGDMKSFKKECLSMIAEVGNKYSGVLGYDDMLYKKKLDGN